MIKLRLPIGFYSIKYKTKQIKLSSSLIKNKQQATTQVLQSNFRNLTLMHNTYSISLNLTMRKCKLIEKFKLTSIKKKTDLHSFN
jgi:hypothetical protein